MPFRTLCPSPALRPSSLPHLAFLLVFLHIVRHLCAHWFAWICCFVFSICVFICVCTSTCDTHVEIRGQSQVSVLVPFPPFVWITFSLDLKLPHIGQHRPGYLAIKLPGTSYLWVHLTVVKSQAHAPHVFRWVLDIQTEVLTVVKQTLYQLLHLPSLWTITVPLRCTSLRSSG